MTAIHSVSVAGTTCAVTAYRKSGTLWIAEGEYGGTSIRTQDRSEEAVLARWRDAAGAKHKSETAPARQPGRKARPRKPASPAKRK